MDVKMIHAFAPEKIREIARVAGARWRLHFSSVFALVGFDQFPRPSIFLLRFLFPKPHDWRRRRVMDRRLERSRVRMPNARQRRMNRPNHQLEPAPLQLEHLHVAKRLREHGVTRIEVAKTHIRIPETGKGIAESKTFARLSRS